VEIGRKSIGHELNENSDRTVMTATLTFDLCRTSLYKGTAGQVVDKHGDVVGWPGCFDAHPEFWSQWATVTDPTNNWTVDIGL